MKRQRKTATSLKVSSLSELRDLQRQATQKNALKTGAHHTTDSNHDSSDRRSTPTTQPRRRPHRFLPPSTRPITPVHRQAAEPSAHALPDPSEQADASSAPPSGHAPVVEPVVSDEDIALFRRVVASVTPSPKTDRILHPPIPPATAAQLQERRQHATGQADTPALDVSDQYASAVLDHDDTVFLQAGHGPHLIKGLKKGKWPVQASLDLHGSNLDEARERMDRFIQSCRDHRIRCVRIVHGKGYGSKGGDPVLKETVRRWLSQLAVVQAYIESDEANGGAGAVLVLLSKP